MATQMVTVAKGKTIPITNQSKILEDGSRVSTLSGDNGEILGERFIDEVTTIHEAFERACGMFGDLPFVGKRSGPGKCMDFLFNMHNCALELQGSAPDLAFEWVTYKDVKARVDNMAAGLVRLGLGPNSLVGMFSKNCQEFLIGQFAMFSQSMVVVPLYDTLGPEALTHILDQAKLSVTITGERELQKILEQGQPSKYLKTVIKIGEVTTEEKAKATDVGLILMSMTDVERSGAEEPKATVPPSSEDLAVICYTSGTTGYPKGAMTTHRNLIAAVSNALQSLSLACQFDTTFTHLSYLPLAHLMEQVAAICVLFAGGRIGFFRGDPKLLIQDIQALQPTLLVVVPRILNKLYDKVMDGISQAGFIKRFMFNTALYYKMQYLSQGEVRNDTWWDWLVFYKIRQLLGGRVQMLVTGAAPVSSEVLSFMRATLGCGVYEGYGQTESTAVATVTLIGDQHAGHVGPPCINTSVKLVSVPEMNYVAENNEGEICFRGPAVFKGYLHDKEKTREALDKDGWLHSGDIGRWNANGTLSVIDRKKNIFKLSQGEYVAPEKIEMIYLQVPYISQVLVHGDSLETTLVGIVVPDEEVAVRWAKDHGMDTNIAVICQNTQFKSEILKAAVALGKEKGLKGFEQVKAIHLHPEQLTAEHNLMTPTMKMKRPQLRAFFSSEIAAMYDALRQTS